MQRTPVPTLRAALLAALLGTAALAPASAAGVLDKARESTRLTIGHAADMRPYAYTDGGKPAGYAVEVCAKVAAALKDDLKLNALNVEFVAVPPAEAIAAVEQGKVDLLCGAEPSLERRAKVDFSIPIMLSGTSVALSADAPPRLVQALSGDASASVAWRGSPDLAPQRVRLAVVGGTALEKNLESTLKQRRIVAEVVPAADTAAGLQLLANGGAHAFFGDRAQLLGAVARDGGRYQVLGRIFRRDVVALALPRGDNDFRLAVDRALSRLYRSAEMTQIYTRHFGPPGPDARDFFQLVSLPD